MNSLRTILGQAVAEGHLAEAADRDLTPVDLNEIEAIPGTYRILGNLFKHNRETGVLEPTGR